MREEYKLKKNYRLRKSIKENYLKKWPYYAKEGLRYCI
jgi:hypothetical protein